MRTPHHYSLYWSNERIDELANRYTTFVCAASGYFHTSNGWKVGVGDVLWLVTLRLPARTLCLRGRLEVGLITSDEAKVVELIGRKPDLGDHDRSQMPKQRYFVVAREGMAQKYRNVDLSTVMQQIRFEGDPSPILVRHGQVQDHQQIRALRLLTQQSVKVLEHAWASSE